MKRFYTALIFSLSVIVANAQYDEQFDSYKDSTVMKNNGPTVDFLVTMPDTGFLIVQCLPKQAIQTFLQMWLSSLNIKSYPYLMTCVSSDAPVDLSINASYITTGGASFGTGSIPGGGTFDTLLYQQASFTTNLDELQLTVSSTPVVITFDWIRMGSAAHPIQANVPLAPKVLPGQSCTLKISNLYYFYAPNYSAPIDQLICTPTSTSSYIESGTLKAEEDAENNSFNIVFTTKAATKSNTAFIDVEVKSLNGAYKRVFNLAVNVTPTAGTEEPVSSEFKIYPVPVQNTLTVELPDDGGYQISVVNAAGSMVMSQVAAKGISKTEINTSSLASGAYSLIISNNESLISKKFTK